MNGIGMGGADESARNCSSEAEIFLEISLPLQPILKQNRTFTPAALGIVGVLRTGYYILNNMTDADNIGIKE